MRMYMRYCKNMIPFQQPPRGTAPAADARGYPSFVLSRKGAKNAKATPYRRAVPRAGPKKISCFHHRDTIIG